MIKTNYDPEDIAKVAYETMAMVDAMWNAIESPAWDDLNDVARGEYVVSVTFLLDHPTASEKNWHDAWRARNRQLGAPAEMLEEYENLDAIHRLKIRLWRHIVHAFID